MFRIPRSSDSTAVVSIMNEAIEERRNAYLVPFSKEDGEKWFNELSGRARYMCIVEEDSILGWGTLTDYRGGRGALSSSAEITFYLGRTGRGKGLGKKLVSHLEEVALEQRIQHIIAILLDDNLPSQSLLLKMGYEVWANFEGIAHFPDGDRGHMYMGKHLTK